MFSSWGFSVNDCHESALELWSYWAWIYCPAKLSGKHAISCCNMFAISSFVVIGMWFCNLSSQVHAKPPRSVSRCSIDLAAISPIFEVKVGPHLGTYNKWEPTGPIFVSPSGSSSGMDGEWVIASIDCYLLWLIHVWQRLVSLSGLCPCSPCTRFNRARPSRVSLQRAKVGGPWALPPVHGFLLICCCICLQLCSGEAF